MALFDFFRRRKRRKLARKGFAQTAKIRRKESAARAQRQAPESPRPLWIPVLVLLAAWGVSSFSVVQRRSARALQFVAGQRVSRNFYTQYLFDYEDREQTQRKRDQAASQVPPVYRIDPASLETSKSALALVGRAVAQGMAGKTTAAAAGDGEDSASRYLARLSAAQRTALEYVCASPQLWKQLRRLVDRALEEGVASSAEIESLQSDMLAAGAVFVADIMEPARKSFTLISDLLTPKQLAATAAAEFAQQVPANADAVEDALAALLSALIRPNLRYDSVATGEAQERDRAAVPVVREVVAANVLLLRRGQRVTEQDLYKLERHQEQVYQHSGSDWRKRLLDTVLGVATCLVLVLAAAYSLHTIRPDLIRRHRLLLLIGLVLVLQVVLTRVVTNVYYANWSSTFFLFSVLPLSLAGMLLAPLVGIRVAIWAGIYTSVIAALHNDQSLRLLMLGALSSITAGMLMRKARKRYHVFRTGVVVSLTVFAVDCLFLLGNEIPLEILPKMLGLAFFNGILVATLTSSVLPLFEFLFGVTTDLSLLELSDLNHPLLKRLQLEAPGTYHHSLMVATLSEQAAEAIGANPLLARVCAYFHDVGKLSYPEYFSENIRGRSPHEELQPRMSCLVILNHVKEGINLALKHKLKRPIRDVIAQHHGTSLVYFFYHRAQQNHTGRAEAGAVGEGDYRYPGPLPIRKEIMLISIADACEAASRSLEKPTPQKVESLVNEIVTTRIEDQQLEKAELTFAELAVATESISKNLSMMLHDRVRYPKEYENEGKTLKTAAPAASGRSAAPAGRDPTPD